MGSIHSRTSRPAAATLRAGVALLGALLAAAALAATPLVPGEPPPVDALPGQAGQNVRLSEFRGEVVLLSFWASWCGRCQEQLAELAELQRQHAADGLRVVAVNIEKDGRAAADVARRLGVTVLHDADQDVSRAYDPGKLRLTVLVDAHGLVRHVHES